MKVGTFLKNMNIDFMKKSKIFFSIATIFILLSLIVPMFKGFNAGVDFKGGIIIDLQAANNDNNSNNIKEILAKHNINDIMLKEFSDNIKQVVINAGNLENVNDIPALLDTIKLDLSNNNYGFLQSQFVGPSISGSLVSSAIFSIIGSCLGILIYLWVRFNWQYGFIGLITLLHNVLITLLFLSLFHFELDTGTIAGILTVVAYSINDTVVVFDQIRENIKKYPNETNYKIINRSINQVFSRSLATMLTVIMVLIPIFILANDSLKSFSFTLIVGIIFGAYSSICLAAPLLPHVGNMSSKIIRKQSEQ